MYKVYLNIRAFFKNNKLSRHLEVAYNFLVFDRADLF